MYRILCTLLTLLFLLSIPLSQGLAQSERQRFGSDPRHEEAEKIDYQVSDKKFRWDMVMPWSKGLLFYDVAQHFADSVRLASAGRLNIRVFAAGELVPAMESFDAVSSGSADVGHDWPGYWKGKNEAFVAFASVPFGLDAEGYNVWLYEMGGAEMMDELYGRYNLKAFPGGNVGQELGLFSNKRATTMEDYKGLRVRTPGWYMDILTNLGASVSPLPGGEIYLALERGVIDAAEFSTPAITYPMGFDQVTDYVIMPGVHQPSCQSAIFINQDSWEELPRDLQEIVKLSAKETQLWSNAWNEYYNAEAVHRLQKSVEFVKMDREARKEFAQTTKKYLDQLKEEYPDVKKVLDSQDEFKEHFAKWRDLRSGVEPYPIDMYIEGKMGDH
ncbi:MAG: TRAP transporter substrate-binding protein DctP [Desulfovermiculus sp.]|nr:TRAP transporter substrate-binding protein DctP [Desulfovermiculus sp.]